MMLRWSIGLRRASAERRRVLAYETVLNEVASRGDRLFAGNSAVRLSRRAQYPHRHYYRDSRNQIQAINSYIVRSSQLKWRRRHLELRPCCNIIMSRFKIAASGSNQKEKYRGACHYLLQPQVEQDGSVEGWVKRTITFVSSLTSESDTPDAF